MTKDELIAYVLNTPENTNPNVFKSLLDQYISENSGSSGDDQWRNARVTLINNNPEDAFNFYNPFTDFIEDVFTETTINLPVPKDGLFFLGIHSFGNFDSSIEPICTGDIEYVIDGFEITGDGTITLAAADGTAPK